MYLCRGDNFLAVSCQGAMIYRWRYRGRDILFPQDLQPQGKLRGGLFEGFPFFGPPPTGTNYPQHGYLRHRIATRQRVSYFADDTKLISHVEFDFEVPFGADPLYQWGHVLKVMTRVTEDGFQRSLTLRWLPQDLWRVISPEPSVGPLTLGIHPYFHLPHKQAMVGVGRRVVDISATSELPDPLPLTEEGVVEVDVLGLGQVTIRLEGQLWRDGYVWLWRDSDEHLCVEPVMGQPWLAKPKDRELFSLAYSMSFTPVG